MKVAVTTIILIFCLFPFFSQSQTNKELLEIYYGIPIDSSRAVMIDHITKDQRFNKAVNNNSNSYSALYDDLYYGKIMALNIPSSIQSPVTATIEITWGVGEYRIAKKDYGAHISIIRIDYFFPDKSVADAYCNYLLEQLKGLTTTNIESKANNVIYKGKKIQFPDPEKRYLTNFNLLKPEPNEAGQLVRLEYRREGR